MNITERLSALRKALSDSGAHACVIPTQDSHGSEYVCGHFKLREYFSGFDGSAGTLVVTLDKAALWTDGRYFLQAQEQLFGSTITLMKEGEDGTPSVEAYLCENLSAGMTVAFDGRTVSYAKARAMEKRLCEKGISVLLRDIAGEAAENRPPLPAEPVWELPPEYAGQSRKVKLARIADGIKKHGADGCVISALDEIAWALNLRGNDIAYNPVFLAHLLFVDNSVTLFANAASFSDDIVSELNADGVVLRDYNEVYRDLGSYPAGKTLLADPEKTNCLLLKSLNKASRLVEKPDIIAPIKAVKNSAEIDGERAAHIRDGVAVTRFMRWLKENVSGGEITELSAAEKLEQLRREQENYLGQSFDPIIAYGAHGAVVHYSADEHSNAALLPKGLVLCDTGGHYLDGTTDITRTIALGELTDEEKKCFTLVLMGHLNLASACFLQGTRGSNLDYTAREPLWRNGLDYLHGTGHGVGFVLNVHECPPRIHWRVRSGATQNDELFAGMIFSDEPGFYAAGKFGIRHENLLLCKEQRTTEYGKFLCFETLTLVPFDLDAVDISLMSDRERGLLNSYHKRVFDTLSPYLSDDDRAFLEKATRKI